MVTTEDFSQRINYLPRADPPHMLDEPRFKGAYNFSTACTDYLQKYYLDILNIKRSWNFINPSKWFLESIKEFVEFTPDLLGALQPRSILPFIESFRYTGTYRGFELLCQGIFGEEVNIEYVEPYTIIIHNIETPIKYAILGEGEQDFFLLTEDLTKELTTEDVFVPPSGLWVVIDILKENLPAGIAEIATINFGGV
jgi:hypothetical protein